jgi:hypothetical protein
MGGKNQRRSSGWQRRGWTEKEADEEEESNQHSP